MTTIIHNYINSTEYKHERNISKELDEKDMIILKLDLEITRCVKQIEKFEYLLKFQKRDKELLKKQTRLLIEKDKKIEMLKKSIKTNFLNFTEEIIPSSYLRISKRFPHLSLEEIIAFEKRVRENGGSIKVHGGDFKLVFHETYQSWEGRHEMRRDAVYISWTCCHSVMKRDGGFRTKWYPVNNIRDWNLNQPRCCETIGDRRRCEDNSGYCCGAINLRNPQPDNECDNASIFYLNEEDEKSVKIGKVAVEDVSKSIAKNIETLRETVDKHLSKIEKLKNLSDTLELLI